MTAPEVSRLERERIATLTLDAVFDPLVLLRNAEARSRRAHAHLALTNLLGTWPREVWPTHIVIHENGTVAGLDLDAAREQECITPGRVTTITKIVLEEPEPDADTVALNEEAAQLFATYDDVAGAWPDHDDVWRAIALTARRIYRPTGPSMGDLADITEDELADALLAAARESKEPGLDPTVPHGFDMNPIPAERGICDRCRCGKEVTDPIHSGPRTFDDVDDRPTCDPARDRQDCPKHYDGSPCPLAIRSGPRTFDDVMAFPEEDPGADLDEPKDPDGDLAERVDAIALTLHQHITVPSWWNKRTDARLAKLEEVANIPGPLDVTRTGQDTPGLGGVPVWEHTPPPEPKPDAAQAARIEQLEARIAQLDEALEAAQLRSIEARNPGIDMDKVKATRAEHAKPEATAEDYSFWRAEDAVVEVTVVAAVAADDVDARVAHYVEERKRVGDSVESYDYNHDTGTLSYRVRLATPANLMPYKVTVDDEQFDEILNLLPHTPRGWFVVPRSVEWPDAGVGEIAVERRAQIDRWGLDHDDEHKAGELLLAALCYFQDARRIERVEPVDLGVPPLWPFEPESWRPSHDPVRELVKAGALIAAEIDRLRASGNKS